MVVAALLHDVVEDSHTSLDQVALHFGVEVAALVDQLTKFGGVLYKFKLSKAENQQKLLHGGKEAIQIKLADRLHNMRTIKSLPLAKQKEKAEETLQHYVPLASLVGLSEVGQMLHKVGIEVLGTS